MLKNCVKYCDDSLALDPQIRFPNVSDPRHEEATLSFVCCGQFLTYYVKGS